MRFTKRFPAWLDRVFMRLTMGAIGMALCSSFPVGIVLLLRWKGAFTSSQLSGFDSPTEALRCEAGMFAFALFSGALLASRLGFFGLDRSRG